REHSLNPYRARRFEAERNPITPRSVDQPLVSDCTKGNELTPGSQSAQPEPRSPEVTQAPSEGLHDIWKASDGLRGYASGLHRSSRSRPATKSRNTASFSSSSCVGGGGDSAAMSSSSSTSSRMIPARSRTSSLA